MENPRLTAALLSSCLLGLGFAAQPVLADDDHHRVRANLSGYNEVQFVTTNTGPGTPLTSAAIRGAISTKAKGTFRATIDEGGQSISYRLTYQDLEGAVTQAHIHFGQSHTVGGIVVWLCETDAAQHPVVALRRPVTPQCPEQGTVTGTIGPEKVLTVAGQGIAAGEFEELVRAIRAGATYANVHSALHPPGEIRGQISD